MERKAKKLPQGVQIAVSGLLCATAMLPLAGHAASIPLYQVSSMAGQASAMSPVKPVPLSALPGGSTAMAGMPTAMGLASKLHNTLNQVPSLPALPASLPGANALPAALPSTNALPTAGKLPASRLPSASALPTALPSAGALPGLGSLPMAMGAISPFLKVAFSTQTPVASANGCGHASLSQFGLCVSATSLLGSLHLSTSGMIGLPVI